VLDRLRKVMADGARGSLRVARGTRGQDLAVLAVEPLRWDPFGGVDLEVRLGGVGEVWR
jgi:hypothetical protein